MSPHGTTASLTAGWILEIVPVFVRSVEDERGRLWWREEAKAWSTSEKEDKKNDKN